MSELAFFLHRLETTARSAQAATESSEGETPAAGFWPRLRESGVLTSAAGLIGAHMLETCFLLGSWMCVGSGALSGRLDYGWLAAWALALLTTVPLHALSTWLQGVVTMGFGGVLKQWMQDTAMSAGRDGVRSKGPGRSLSEVLETVALDDLATNGGIASVLAAVELLIAPVLLYWGGDTALEAIILLGWEILTIALIKHNLHLRTGWTEQRLAMTHRLIDNMAAQRTRLTQQSPGYWHAGDDADIERYLQTSRALDASTARIETAIPRSYLIVAFLALAPGFVSGTTTLAQLAVVIGVILFAKTALERLCFGFSRPATAWVAWQCIRPESASASAPVPDVEAVSTAHEPLSGIPVLQARDLAFTYPGRLHPVLSKCSLSVERGDHVLLEGASGSGKSTLAGLLAGTGPASAGYILAGGLDRHTVGDAAWRRRIALVPQDHENHIFSASLLFNLLLGSTVPATVQDEAEADALCRELGLGPLLERMPAGLQQLVGDGGWELSQGERSRIFLARALLQRAELLILDETFAALDPDSLRQCVECVRRRAPTMIVIAHP